MVGCPVMPHPFPGGGDPGRHPGLPAGSGSPGRATPPHRGHPSAGALPPGDRPHVPPAAAPAHGEVGALGVGSPRLCPTRHHRRVPEDRGPSDPGVGQSLSLLLRGRCSLWDPEPQHYSSILSSWSSDPIVSYVSWSPALGSPFCSPFLPEEDRAPGRIDHRTWAPRPEQTTGEAPLCLSSFPDGALRGK